MCFKRRKTNAEFVEESRKLIQSNSKTVGKLTMFVSNNEELVSKLKDLEEKMKYLKPVKNRVDIKIDKMISDRLDATASKLSNSVSDVEWKIADLISYITTLLVSRKD